ncbi:MAG TPA: hypothetical protein PKK26_03765 [Candidatus Wallbacteria bacterium]|nr:hypothetical protein [Candidatus Wallbacteria bacterium]
MKINHFSIAIFMIISVVSLVSGPGNALAAAPDISYIQQNFSAAALGMGGAFSTFSSDSTAMFYNPAALARLKTSEIMATSSRSDFDQSADSFNFSMPHGKKKRAFGGLAYMKDEISGIEGRDNFGNLTGTFSDKEQIIGYGLGSTNEFLKKKGIYYGFFAKHMSHSVMGATGSGLSIDLGALREFKNGQNASVVLRNAVGSLKWSNTKSSASENFARVLSLGYSAACTQNGRLAAELAIDDSADKTVTPSIGFEKKISDKTVVRTGINDGRMAYGMGFSLKQSRIDYAFSKGAASDLHKISAVFYTDKNK